MHPPHTRHDAIDSAHAPDLRPDDANCFVLDEAKRNDHFPDQISEIIQTAQPELITDADIFSRFQRLAADNEALRRELTHAYERLNVVLELSRNSSSSDDPDELRVNLWQQLAETLGLVSLYIHDGKTCRRLPFPGDLDLGEELTLDNLQIALAEEIADVRETRRATIVDGMELECRGLPPVHALLNAFQDETSTTQVTIALRESIRPLFDRDDCLAAETVLVHGGHILRNILVLQHLKCVSLETVGALANAIEARDQYTGGHSERVGWLAAMTGRALQLSPEELQLLEWSGLLHDVGKIGIPEHILNKPGALTDDEFEHIKRHPRLGYDVLRPLSSLRPVLEAVLYHHENWDGSGYPDGLKGEQIPILARILHVVDIFDALTSTRSYRQRLSIDLAIRMLIDGAGKETDPVVTAAFVEAFQTFAHENPQACAARFGHISPGF